MVRASKKKENGETQSNPEVEERKRLKRLAISRNLLSQTPSKSSTHLNPSKLALKHHGADILKKSQRKNRFLFSFPGLLAPVSGGKIGELKDVGTKNPILYLDFPQGQVKLFGTIVYPKNRYLTLQFSRGGKNVMCEDYFDNMIVFSEAWWIGTRDENPEELRLEFPKDLSEGKELDFDFKGGAGATCQEKSGGRKHQEDTEPLSPTSTPEDYMSDDSNCLTRKDVNDPKELMEVTPVRHSTRTSVKRFNLADVLSGDDSDKSDPEISEVKENIVIEKTADNVTTVSSLNIQNEDSILVAPASDDTKVASRREVAGKNKEASLSVNKSKGASASKRGKLVQATISTLFKNVDKKSTGTASTSTPEDSGKKSSHVNLKRKKDQVEDEQPKSKKLLQDSAPSKKSAPNKEKTADKKTLRRGKQSQVAKDPIEEISSDSEDDIPLAAVMKI